MKFLVTIAALLAMQGQTPDPSGQLTFRANPPLVCHDPRQPYLNFDFILVNNGPGDVRFNSLRGLVLDSSGSIIERRFIANAPWLNTLTAGADRLLYNPLFFSSVKAGTRIRFELDYSADTHRTVTVELQPRTCQTQASLILPLAGRVLVWDGHDFLSHHRRSGYLGQEDFGITDNFQRFALDFMMVDEQGRMSSGDRNRNESWFSWNQPVRAPAAGIVAAIHNEQPDNDLVGVENRWTRRSIADDEMTTYGNYVLIDHGTGEFSLLAHLRQGSVVVKKGQRVQSGQLVGRVGNSGSSMGPHLHYELRNGWGVRGIRTMPPYFRRVTVVGTGEEANNHGIAVNTGDVLTAR